MKIERELARELARQLKLDRKQENMHGEGMYVFENNTKGDVMLPRPTQSGRKVVARGEQFIGDNYYFRMIPSELKLIKEISAPEQRLLVEQPPTVTSEGTVEYKQQINETPVNSQVLLTETPVDGIKIIR